jgi:hypothetical protein
MTPARNGSRPWTLSWVHIGLALAVGAGLPLLWMAISLPDKPAADGVADAGILSGQHHAAAVATGQQAAAVSAPAVPPPAAARADPQAPVSAAQIHRERDPNGDQSPDITDFINNGEVPTMAEVIRRLHAAGVHGGLGAFNPPGTRPPLVGIAVAEDFALPPGYVRHHQVTDDGQRIEPILMFSPDHPLVAAAGQAAAQPQDLVVPPALAPAGLPIRHIVVPPTLDAGK